MTNSRDENEIRALIERWAKAVRDEAPLQSRLTMGLRKIDGRWRILHERHSSPAE